MCVVAKFDIDAPQYRGPDGTFLADRPEAFSDPAARLRLFKQMLFVRTSDSTALALPQ